MTMLLNNGWAERDIGEVEVAHLLLEEPLVCASRQFETTSLGGNLTMMDPKKKDGVSLPHSLTYNAHHSFLPLIAGTSQPKSKEAFAPPAKMKWYAERPAYQENCSLHDMLSQCKSGKYETVPRSAWKVPHIIPWYGRRISSFPTFKEESYARQRLLLHKPWRRQEDVVAGFEHHGDRQHVAALEAWLSSPTCPPVLRWEKQCCELDKSRGDDFSGEPCTCQRLLWFVSGLTVRAR